MNTSRLRLSLLSPSFVLCLIAVPAQAGSPAKSTPRAVTTSPISSAVLPRFIETQGVIAAWQEAIVSARITGAAITHLHAAVGEPVRRGQLLASLDERSVRAELDKASAQEAQARTSFQQAETDLRRMRDLKAQGAISAQNMAHTEAQHAIAQAQWQSANASTRAAKIRLDDTRIVAPDEGVITARGAMLGQVPPLGSELFRMIRQQRLEWRAELTAAQMQQVKIDMTVQLRLTDGSTAQGKVRQLGAALDHPNRLGIAYIDILKGSQAKAGMIASGRLILGQDTAMLVPAASVLLRDGRSVVFRVEGDKVMQMSVTTGQRFQDKIEILKGLSEKDHVVLDGAGFLIDGDRIQIVGDGAQTHKATAAVKK